LKLNGSHQLLFYTDDVNILGGSVLMYENIEALVVASMETRLEADVVKTKYVVMSGDQDAG